MIWFSRWNLSYLPLICFFIYISYMSHMKKKRVPYICITDECWIKVEHNFSNVSKIFLLKCIFKLENQCPKFYWIEWYASKFDLFFSVKKSKFMYWFCYQTKHIIIFGIEILQPNLEAMIRQKNEYTDVTALILTCDWLNLLNFEDWDIM